MEVPVLVVVYVVDPHRRRDGFVDFSHHAHICREEFAHALKSKSIDVGVVGRSVLHAAIARAKRCAPLRFETLARERRSPPLWYVGLPFAEGVSGRDNDASVLLEYGVGVNHADVQIQASCQHVRTTERNF